MEFIMAKVTFNKYKEEVQLLTMKANFQRDSFMVKADWSWIQEMTMKVSSKWVKSMDMVSISSAMGMFMKVDTLMIWDRTKTVR